MRHSVRSSNAVPWRLQGALAAALIAQIVWGLNRPVPTIAIDELPAPPPAAALRLMALGQPDVLARTAMLWLQAFDYQPGASIAIRDLDYSSVERWLDRILELDADFQYPLLAAARLYAEAGRTEDQRRMLAFIARHYSDDPTGRWQWMAHAVYIAKHRLGDLDLAFGLARELSRAPAGDLVPHWARQMHIFVLEDMGEVEAAKVLLGGLLDSGEITDPHERRFLSRRLHELEQRN